MKNFFTGALLALVSLAACQNAQTQNQPQVVVASPDGTPTAAAVPSATPAALSTPAVAATPAGESAYASLPSPTPHQPGTEKLSYSSCNVDGPYIAMTFDDGPSEKLTPKLLDILKARGIHATFFVVGQNANQYPDILRRMVAEGHEIGNHSWSHPQLTKLSPDGVRKQIEGTNEAITRATGQPVTLLRPPYGATSSYLNHYFASQYHLKIILWSVDPLDWKYRNSERVTREITANARPGSIVLSHDIHATTVDAMPATLDALIAKGYKFVTVSELIAMDHPTQLVKKEAKASPSPAAQSTPPAAER